VVHYFYSIPAGAKISMVTADGTVGLFSGPDISLPEIPPADAAKLFGATLTSQAETFPDLLLGPNTDWKLV
jgi:hypothetical protein